MTQSFLQINLTKTSQFSDIAHNFGVNKSIASTLKGEGEWASLVEMLVYTEFSTAIKEVASGFAEPAARATDSPVAGATLHASRKLLNTVEILTPETKYELKKGMKRISDTIVSTESKAAGCIPANLERRCLKSINPDLLVLGAMGGVAYGFVKGRQRGYEAVFDTDTLEIGFFQIDRKDEKGLSNLLRVEASMYTGVGYKGDLRSKSLTDAYSGYFICGQFGVALVGEMSVTVCITGEEYVKPKWRQVKSVTVGVGVAAAIPTVIDIRISKPKYKSLGGVKCEHPHCVAGLLALVPGEPIGKIQLMTWFMERYCAPRSKYTTNDYCRSYRKIKKFVNGLVKGIKLTSKKLLQAIADDDLDALIGKGLKAAHAKLRGYIKIAQRSPELLKNTYFDIPRGKGTYLKIRDCAKFEAYSEPYWKCSALDFSFRKVKKTSEIGLKGPGAKQGRIYWDYNAKPEKTGYGMFFPDGRQCVSCKMFNRRVWAFDTDTGYQIAVCRGSDKEFQSVPIMNPTSLFGAKSGSCNVLYRHTT